VDALGKENVLAVTAKLVSFPEREFEEAFDFCKENRIAHEIVDADQLSVPGFQRNPPDRCYLCKKHLFTGMMNRAAELGFTEVAEGSNLDDLSDYRPGMKAIAELGVHSPLREAGLYKADIRALSRELGLPTWSKPSLACLATRFPYGEELTADKINAGTLSVERLLLKGENGLFYAINAQAGGLTSTQLTEEQYQNAISGTALVARSVTADKIAAKSITANEIAAGTITAAEIDVAQFFAADIQRSFGFTTSKCFKRKASASPILRMSAECFMCSCPKPSSSIRPSTIIG
jgi:PP-loop superfamily ATP-utilizing enzyme